MGHERRGSDGGFTLIEVTIVILVIGVLLAIAIPQMFQSRMRSQVVSCRSNIRIFEAVKQQWAMDQNIQNGTVVTLSDLIPYLKAIPVCPGGGTYDLATTGSATSCSIPEHAP
jgi:type IV pilus assembly protein PilA